MGDTSMRKFVGPERQILGKAGQNRVEHFSLLFAFANRTVLMFKNIGEKKMNEAIFARTVIRVTDFATNLPEPYIQVVGECSTECGKVDDHFKLPFFLCGTVKELEDWKQVFTFWKDPQSIEFPSIKLERQQFHLMFYAEESDYICSTTNTEGSSDGLLYSGRIQRQFPFNAKPRLVLIKRVLPLKALTKKDSMCSAFEKGEVLGLGAFGAVYAVLKKDTQVSYAMKEQPLDKISFLAVMNERELLKNTKSPFLPTLFCSFVENNKITFIMDKVDGGHLETVIKNFCPISADQVKFYLSEIICAVGWLHHHAWIHNDIKPSNILLDVDGHIKLTDFGLSVNQKIFFTSKGKSVQGTRLYMAPEVNGFFTDWWAVGIVTYELSAGTNPVDDALSIGVDQLVVSRAADGKDADTYEAEDSLYNSVFRRLRKNPNFGISDQLSPQLQSLVSGLLNWDHNKRLGYNGSTDQIKEHEFLKDINFDQVEMQQGKPPITIKQMHKHNEEIRIQNKAAIARGRADPPTTDRTVWTEKHKNEFFYINTSKKW